jgi:AcrR family transcriptional regulator
VESRPIRLASAQRRVRPRGAATRERLLGVATRLFTRMGYEQATMQDIARLARVGVGTVYHHFPDKRALLLELVDRQLARLAAMRGADLRVAELLEGDTPAVLEHWIRAGYEQLRKHPTLGLVVLAQSEHDPEIRARRQRYVELRIARLTALIELAQQRGVFRADLEPAGAAFLIEHTVGAAAMQLLVREVSEPPPDVVLGELAKMITRYLLGEDRWRPPRS